MNALQSNHQDFMVLGFPCNQFGLQEPGANATEIFNGIQYVRPGNGFVPNFKLFKKIEVNGDNEEPLYTFLKKHCPSTRDGFASKDSLFYSPFKVNDVRWNFEKFLVSRNGKPVKRYDASTHPNVIEADIVKLLIQNNDHITQQTKQ
ncbi:glutathione peroxidase 6 [Cryptotermes secundus]|uniref:glutathione peroxidase 6 n=1 Tax=Cryptotermes secundus TaxID=105785 RepID=UPI000CD7D35D|nr:glutathione peroxidase 6 [Cryptotermes secundus]